MALEEKNACEEAVGSYKQDKLSKDIQEYCTRFVLANSAEKGEGNRVRSQDQNKDYQANLRRGTGPAKALLHNASKRSC